VSILLGLPEAVGVNGYLDSFQFGAEVFIERPITFFLRSSSMATIPTCKSLLAALSASNH